MDRKGPKLKETDKNKNNKTETDTNRKKQT